MLQCDKCSGQILEGSIYCPHCGDPVTEGDQPIVGISQTSVLQVEITFGRSSSANYDRAIQICRNIPNYSEVGEGSSIIHSVTLPITEVDLLIKLYELVGSWKSSRMLINGQQETKSALVYHGVGCYRNRQRAYNKEQYCYGEKSNDFNIWGCVRLQMPINEWGAGWLDFGSMDKNGVWHFDKDRIRHNLELQIHGNELCPVMDKQRIFETLEHLPDCIDPKSDSRWAYRTEYQEIKGEYKEVAVGIKPVMSKASAYIMGDYKPDWKDERNDPHTLRIEAQPIKIQIELQPDPPKMAPPRKKQGTCLGLIVLFVVVSTAVLLTII